MFDFERHLRRQREFALATFGPGNRRVGLANHIRKELTEIEEDPDGNGECEWIDVIILGLEGAMRDGRDPDEVIRLLVAKQEKNEGRTWPDWRNIRQDEPIEHDRTGEMIAIDPGGCAPPVYVRETPPPQTHLRGRWLPIAQTDRTITDIMKFPDIGMNLRNSETYWVRDEDGRTYQAAWSEGEKSRDYWWDWEGESPVDPVEFMPHPLDPRWASAPEVSDNG